MRSLALAVALAAALVTPLRVARATPIPATAAACDARFDDGTRPDASAAFACPGSDAIRLGGVDDGALRAALESARLARPALPLAAPARPEAPRPAPGDALQAGAGSPRGALPLVGIVGLAGLAVAGTPRRETKPPDDDADRNPPLFVD